MSTLSVSGGNNLYPPEIWARESLLVLSKNNVMANLVHRDFQSDVAEYGDTINTRRPTKFAVTDVSNTATGGGLTVANAAATPLQIVLDQHKAVAFGITQRDQDTSIKNLIEEFMEPALIPMAEKIDADLLNSTNGLALATGAEIVDTGTLTYAAGSMALTDFANIQEKLMENEVPMTSPAGIPNISMVMCPRHYASTLTLDAVALANQSGLNPPPVRTGYAGQVFGMGLYASQNVPTHPDATASPASSAADDLQLSIAFHKNAITLVTRPLEAVNSQFGVRSATVTKDGIGLRAMMSYSHVDMKWIVSIDLLYGFKILDDKLRVLLRDKE